MALRHTGDLAGFVHSYHCTLDDIPRQQPIASIAECLTAQENSPIVHDLRALGCHIVPYQLHLYKDQESTKFGYVTFILNYTTRTATEHCEGHALILRWIREELAVQLKMVHCRVRLAQPPELHSADIFLAAFNHLCTIVDPSCVADTKKVETFVLTKVVFNEEGKNRHFNDAEAGERRSASDELAAEEREAEQAALQRSRHSSEAREDVSARCPTWAVVGTLSMSSLTPQNLAWLKREISNFPELPKEAAGSDAAASRATLLTFLQTALSPLVTVTE